MHFQATSDAPRDPKYVHNLAYRLKEPGTNRTDGIPECELMVRQMRESDYTNSVVILPQHYLSYHSKPHMLSDIRRFCVNGNSVLQVDTTFELTDGLWLTDTCYKNLSLVNEKGENPEFPGPFMWSFKKDRHTYR